MKSTSKGLFLLLGLCLFHLSKSHISTNEHNKSRESEVVNRIKQTVEAIYDHLKKQENFQDVKELLQIDATLKRLEEQTKLITSKLSSDLGRSGVSSNEIQLIENKLESMETELVTNVKGGIRKIADVERQTTAFKNDMEKKLGKMMNVMTSVYEMNQKYVTSTTKPNTEVKESTSRDEKLDQMTDFFNEQFEGLAKKIEESVHIMKIEIRRDLKSLEASTSETYVVCEEANTHINEMKQQCTNLSSVQMIGQGGTMSDHMISKITEKVVTNLTRTQREINERLENKLKDLETKIEQQSVQERPNRKQSKGNMEHVVASENLQITTEKPKEIDRKAPQPSQCVTPTTNKMPKNCWEIQKLGGNCDGVYIIYPEKRRAMYGFCDMTDDKGGWTVLMRRGDFGPRRENFDRNWIEYRDGFGDKQGEFWLGLENIHQLSHQLEVVLRVTLEDFNGNRTFFDYEPFSVASEGMNYRLHVGKITEQAKNYHGYSLRHHNMKPFSTFDRNNDHPTINHAAKFRGGWWYNRGHYALLTAPYLKPSDQRQKWEGMQWHAWSGNNLIKSAEMKIRPKYHNV